MSFEDIVYRGYGPHSRKGGGFSSLGVKSQEAMDEALADGWFRTLPEAIEAHDSKKAVAKPAVVMPAPADDAPPTRAEIEAKCKELGIPVHHKNSDATLLKKIDDALKVKG